MNLNIVKYLSIIWMYICEFESYMNLNLKYSIIDIICIFQMVSTGLSYPTS
jgi:hypothetical protein